MLRLSRRCCLKCLGGVRKPGLALTPRTPFHGRHIPPIEECDRLITPPETDVLVAGYPIHGRQGGYRTPFRNTGSAVRGLQQQDNNSPFATDYEKRLIICRIFAHPGPPYFTALPRLTVCRNCTQSFLTLLATWSQDHRANVLPSCFEAIFNQKPF